MSSAAVSVILPTYNRAAMLAEGLESISTQTFNDWELIVVDDGSTDRNREVVEEFRAHTAQPVNYIYQENQGPGAARQRGIDAARGEFIAFMDSDDPWLPHHLAECVAALQSNPDVDWVVGPARVVNQSTGEVVQENSYYPDGKRRPFLKLHTSHRGDLSVIDDPSFPSFVVDVEFPGGLQASVIRRAIAERIPMRPYRLFDDVGFYTEAVIRGVVLGYLSNVQIIYRIHDDNTSLVNESSANPEKRIAAYRDGVGVFRELLELEGLSTPVRRSLRRKIAEMTFWNLGYHGYLVSGHRKEAFECFRNALLLNPQNLQLWKAFAGQLVKRATS